MRPGSARNASAGCWAWPPAQKILPPSSSSNTAAAATHPLALVGKGVTFDSGGLSLKPSASMEDMKSDMTGAAVVAATMQAVARLDLKVNVTGYLALTENMTGGRAMKLGDVLTMRNGKTVEVLNTDAEGRLILADALSFAAENKPARILDLATLTGACMVALGTKVAGPLLQRRGLLPEAALGLPTDGRTRLAAAARRRLQGSLKSNVADLKNVGGKWGGAITAAKFLEQFVDARPWVHLDIAGPSWSDSDNSIRDAGATGCFVRTLVALLETESPEHVISLRQRQLPRAPCPATAPGIEFGLDPATIHVECLEDLQDLFSSRPWCNGLQPRG